MTATVLLVGSRLLAPTQTQHATFLRYLGDFRFRIVAKRFGDAHGRVAAVPPGVELILLPAEPARIFAGVDIVHVLTGGRIAHHAVRQASLHRLPVAVSFHGGKDLGETLRSPTYRDAYRRMFAETDLLTVPARAGIQALLQAGAVRERVRLLPPGVTVESTVSATQRTIPLLFAGRLIPRKRPQLAIEIAAEMAAASPAYRWVLHIVGYGPMERALRSRAESCGIASRVRFHGYLRHGDLRHLLSRAKILLFTSSPQADLLPPIILEAQAAGAVVIVASHLAGLEGLTDPHDVFPPDEIRAPARRCIELLTQETTWRRASARAHSRIAAAYPLEDALNPVRELYRELASRRGK